MKLSELVTRIKGTFKGASSILDNKYHGVSIDSRKDCRNKIFVALKGERFDGHNFVKEAFKKGAVLCVVSEEVDVPHILVKDSLYALHEIARIWRFYVKPKIVGITGSSGKTTTKEMLKYALSFSAKCVANKGNENNLIGLPFNLANMPLDTEIYVAEMGTNSFGEIKTLSWIACPDIAIITTIGESHLEGLKDVEGVFREKMDIISSMEGGYLLFDSNSPFFERAKQMCESQGVNIIPLGRKGDLGWVEEETPYNFRFNIDGDFVSVKLKVCGRHNGFNALFALVACHILGFDWKEAAFHLSTFSPSKGRFVVEKLGAITLIDDTYNANPLSTKAALKFLSTLGGRRIFVFGSMLELGDKSKKLHQDIGYFAHDCGIDLLITYGDEAKYTAYAFMEAGGKALIFENHEGIIEYLISNLKNGDNILVKGSRGMRMEKVIEGIKGCFGS